jgi:hypothetical protein
VADGSFEESDGAGFLFVGHDLAKGEARMIVDGNVDELPSGAGPCGALIGLAGAVAGDAVADGVEAAELFDVDMNDLAWCCALVTRPGLGGFDCGKAVEATASEDATDGGRGEAGFGSDRSLGAALPAQGFDGIADGERRLAWR